MKTNIFLTILISFLFYSCKKQKVICTGNCYPLNVNGKVVNTLTNSIAPNVPLILYQWRYTFSRRTVEEFSTNAVGLFDKTINIDSTMFQNGYFLSLAVKDNNDFMTLPDRGTNRLYDLTSNTFNNLNILVYPKANLTIKLNRNQNDIFTLFQVAYYFVDNEDFNALSILSPQDINKSELSVPTSADIFTKIRVTKRNSSGVTTTTLDSIKCIKGVSNIFSVSF